MTVGSAATWLDGASRFMPVVLLGITPAMAVEAAASAGFHDERFGRIMVATSRVLDRPPLTADMKSVRHDRVNTI